MDSSDEPHSDIVQAYLSGTATEEQMAQFEMRMREDPVFRDLFEAAEAKLHEELETLEPVAPPSGMIDEIVSQIDHGEISPAPVVKIQTRAEPWRTISIVSSLAAAIAIGFHLVPTQASESFEAPVQAIAFLQGENESGLMMVLYDPGTNQLLARFSNIGIAENQVQQLWLVRDGAEAPISLGLISPPESAASISIDIEQNLQPGKDTLAISLEPLGGSQQNGPSGPIILTGPVEAI